MCKLKKLSNKKKEGKDREEEEAQQGDERPTKRQRNAGGDGSSSEEEEEQQPAVSQGVRGKQHPKKQQPQGQLAAAAGTPGSAKKEKGCQLGEEGQG